MSVLGLVAALTGCGGSARLSHDEYQRELRTTWRATGSAIVKGRLAVERASNAKGAAARIADIEDGVRDGADRLDELKPPADAEEPNSELVTALRAMADELETIRARSGDEGLRPRQDFGRQLERLEGVRRVRAALEKLQSAGYQPA